MSDLLENLPQISPEEEKELFEELVKWADGSSNIRWQNAANDPGTRAKAVGAILDIASEPKTRTEQGAEPSVVLAGKYVFNFRAFVIPAIVLMLEKVSVMVAPGLDSALLPVIDLVGFATEARKVFRVLDPDEMAVFGAICARFEVAEFGHSITNPKLHPTAEGAESWFIENHYQVPDDIEGLLESLYEKGALLRTKAKDGVTIYQPSFLGKKD